AWRHMKTQVWIGRHRLMQRGVQHGLAVEFGAHVGNDTTGQRVAVRPYAQARFHRVVDQRAHFADRAGADSGRHAYARLGEGILRALAGADQAAADRDANVTRAGEHFAAVGAGYGDHGLRLVEADARG